MEPSLPSGTVTFLFTDIEGSTRLWERHPEAMKAALARHDELLRRAVTTHNGRVVKSTGDGAYAVFAAAADAALTAIDFQRGLAADPWPELAPDSLRARAGIHTGEAELRRDDYYGPTLNRTARIMSIGHGGQVLLSSATAELVAGRLSAAAVLRDLGEHRLRDLSRPERVHQLVIEGLASDFPPLKSLDAFPGNLPAQLTSFVGRERELAEVKRLLGTTRLLTLTGPGGTGKTRLSLQAAADVQIGYSHGVWLVELAPLADPALVPGAVAAVFDLSPQANLPLINMLTDYLRGKQLLLILDNCEHLVEACAGLAADLLSAAPKLTILASSREGLNVAGETTYHVPTLVLPDAADTTAAAVCRADAADLFLQRARDARPDFAVSDGNAPAVARIVRRLDGIPLAIELAAARVRVLSPEQIAARLDDRFRLLTGGSRTALPRQQTLRALIDWSYELLNEQEKWFFRQLGVFVGGWTLEAAEEVTSGESGGAGEQVSGGAGEQRSGGEQNPLLAKTFSPAPLHPGSPTLDSDVLDLLAGLVNKSLVVVEEDEGATRYRYLETIRQYARDKLFESGEGEAARDRHVEYFEALVRRLAVGQQPVNMIEYMSYPFTMTVVSANGLGEYEDIRAALEWILEHEPQRALWTAINLGLLTTLSPQGADCIQYLERALVAVEAMPPATGQVAHERTKALAVGYMVLGNITLGLGEEGTARAAYRRAAPLAREIGDKVLLAHILVQDALPAVAQNDIAVLAIGEEVLSIFRELGEPAEATLGVAQILGLMATFYLQRGQIEAARPLAEESIRLAKSSVSEFSPITFYLMGATLSRFLGDIPTAETQYRAGLAEFRRLRNRAFALIMQSDLGHLLRQTGRREEALDLYREAIVEWLEFGNRPAVANMLECFAFIARADRQAERAARLLGAAEAIRDEVHVDMRPWERREYEAEVAALRESLPADVFAAEWAAGRRLSPDEAVESAVAVGTGVGVRQPGQAWLGNLRPGLPAA